MTRLRINLFDVATCSHSNFSPLLMRGLRLVGHCKRQPIFLNQGRAFAGFGPPLGVSVSWRYAPQINVQPPSTAIFTAVFPCRIPPWHPLFGLPFHHLKGEGIGGDCSKGQTGTGIHPAPSPCNILSAGSPFFARRTARPAKRGPRRYLLRSDGGVKIYTTNFSRGRPLGAQ